MRIPIFDGVVGNISTVAMLRQAHIIGTYPNYSTMSGIYGVGKTTVSDISAMVLTCLEPDNGNPCLKCSHCQVNLKALDSTGQSAYIKKINCGSITTEAWKELLKDMFIFTNTTENRVYILEEIHSLNDDLQRMLLNETNNLPENLYIIQTTTEPTKILAELLSRSVQFKFNRLNRKEMKILLERLCKAGKFGQISGKATETLLRYSRGIPRDLTLLTDFLGKTARTEEEICAFLNLIDNASFMSLFSLMKANQTLDSLELLEDLLSRVSPEDFIQQLKEFMLSVTFAINGRSSEGFNVNENNTLREIFNSSNFGGVMAVIEKLDRRCTITDIKFLLLKLTQVLQKKDIANIVSDNAVNARKQSQDAAAIYSLNKTNGLNVSNVDAPDKMADLTLQKVTAFGGGIK